MTIPPGFKAKTQRVTEMVMEMLPKWRHRMTQEEAALGVHLRGNAPLLEALKALIQARITGRASVPVPTDPIACKAILDRDRELQWLLWRLEFVHRSPASVPGHDEDREQPA